MKREAVETVKPTSLRIFLSIPRIRGGDSRLASPFPCIRGAITFTKENNMNNTLIETLETLNRALLAELVESRRLNKTLEASLKLKDQENRCLKLLVDVYRPEGPLFGGEHHD